MKENIELTKKQRRYLIRLRSALYEHWNYTRNFPDSNTIELKETETFVLRIIQNGHYHISSKGKLNEVTQKFNYLINKWGK